LFVTAKLHSVTRVEQGEARSRFAHARRAILATADEDGRPHLVPVTFAVHGDPGDTVVIAIDHKPKRTHNLKRLRNIAANDQVSLLVDEYDDAEWDRLWWVRADGTATVLTAPDPHREHALDHLASKYPQYHTHRPTGPVIRIHIHTWRSWPPPPPASH
jgi:PPOX class probable F420-dependent enzyme